MYRVSAPCTLGLPARSGPRRVRHCRSRSASQPGRGDGAGLARYESQERPLHDERVFAILFAHVPTPNAAIASAASSGARITSSMGTATAGSSPPRRAPSSTPPWSGGRSGPGSTPRPACGPRSSTAVLMPWSTSLARTSPRTQAQTQLWSSCTSTPRCSTAASRATGPSTASRCRSTRCADSSATRPSSSASTRPTAPAWGSGAHRNPPRWLRRRIHRRDRDLCRFPGCGRQIRQIHHVRWWHRDGGSTDTCNLVGFCWAHHHLVHEGGWALEGNADGELTFTSPWGRTLSSRPPPLLPETKQRIHDITGLALG